MKKLAIFLLAGMLMCACNNKTDSSINNDPAKVPMIWNNANVYFLLTDRFNNADLSNDINFERVQPTAVNRGFMGGDIQGITKKIEEGYFNELGITAIWLTPFFEQIHGLVDEGTGATYGFHGYWASDFTALDPNFGTEEDLAALTSTAWKHGIRIVMDVVINHTGPVTDIDPVWGDDWVRTSPRCDFTGYKGTIECTLVDNLPDIKTELEEDVELPQHLLNKWEKEGRLEQEMEELEVFFAETGYPRAPKYYIIKWLTDYIKKYGISAYRLDTAKHTEEGVWAVLRKEADKAYMIWKEAHPDLVANDDPFYMVGEVYNYNISGKRYFDYGDTLVDFFAEGIDHLINFEFKYNAQGTYEELFSKYSNILNTDLEGHGVMNYISSHDDGGPFDQMREKPLEAATKLLLCPGAVQIYYGDESSRILHTEGAMGDAHLRSFMNWEEISENALISGHHTRDVLDHYQKLGTFRKNHPSVGAGVHLMISEDPYVFSRSFENGSFKDLVIIGLDLKPGEKSIPVSELFADGSILKDSYSGKTAKVEEGVLTINTGFDILLLGTF